MEPFNEAILQNMGGKGSRKRKQALPLHCLETSQPSLSLNGLSTTMHTGHAAASSAFFTPGVGMESQAFFNLEAEVDEDSDGDNVIPSGNLFSDADDDSDSDDEDIMLPEEDVKVTCTWDEIEHTSSLEIPEYPDGEKLLIAPDRFDPYDLFRLFLTDEILSLLVEETNRYIRQESTRARKWIDVTIPEMKSYLAIVIIMGLNRQPSLKDYWSTNSEIYGCDLIRRIMTRARFQAITGSLHFANNETANSKSPIYKLQPLLDMLNSRFKAVLSPGKQLTIDKSLIKLRKRLRFRVCHQDAAQQIRAYKLTTLDSYHLNIQVHCTSTNDDLERFPTAQSIVMELMNNYLDNGRIVYANHIFSTIPLVEALAQRSTFYCGPLAHNRLELPPQVTTGSLKKGDIIGCQCQHGTKVVNWKDRRNLLMISSIPQHDCTLHSYSEEHTSKPRCLLDYKMAKDGVDVNDWTSVYHKSPYRGFKWYRKLGLELICNICVENAWALQPYGPQGRRLPITKFREEIVLRLVQEGVPVAHPAAPERSMHTLIEIVGTTSKDGRRCTVCYRALIASGMLRKEAGIKAKKVLTRCDTCPKGPFMCLSCFNYSHRHH
ncbi:piggyBac transposable element-derived protein 1-like isoform X2 [Frankliniella occidentalis]|uniref:PiggyBac transposable element-derived protein 1-like isoform X2 n=1 Tax=Frankliniella occidentalis TaxID=133901 RepID=A0A6J1S8H9_FRAOC|nr:piggyBac transposable element-derived protein 1-like isoform X2 [Frankliniella occidentalis]